MDKIQNEIPPNGIDTDAPFCIVVRTCSPLHLGSGRADIHVDAEIVQDDVGLPYFPAKRLKGLLYESGLEVAEMAALSGLDLIEKTQLDELFQRGRSGTARLNLYMEHYDVLHADLAYLQKKYPSVFRPVYVLDSYASLRWQTRINRETGVAETTSLRNMRVLEKGITFAGTIRLIGGSPAHLKILALAVRNLSQCGGKRTRGFGRIDCTLRQAGKDILTPLVADALKTAERKGGNTDA